mmetsp:Transcript_29530/g.28709  ORF Transcript_29530/g.28709 Transcript_29530/m.28709 type:complete len:150 (+) Transcript_29530:1907-2356(+)
MDSSYFYFITKSDETGEFKLGLTSVDMVEAAFIQAQNDTKSAAIIIEKVKNQFNLTLMYPDWPLGKNVKRLDFDEFNSSFNLLLANLELVQVPQLHRNTINFQGMGERSFYLAFRKHLDHFYALDKSSCMNCWSTKTGQLLWREELPGS